MTNMQLQEEQSQQNEEPMAVTPIVKLLRFLHTGNITSLIPVKTQSNLVDIETTLSCIISMAAARALLPISTIQKVYRSKSYIQVDDVLIALAYCAKQTHSEELRTLANTEAVNLITDQNDFLLFINYCAKISVVLRGEYHLNFGHGMCRMIEKWYEKYSPLDLANMFGEHRSMHGWTHQSVIRKAHIRTKKCTSLEGITTPAEPQTDNTNAASATINEIGTASTSNAAPVATLPAHPQPAIVVSPEDDREQVFRFIFCKGMEYLKYLDDLPEVGPGAKRLKEIQILKTNENVNTAIESIRRHNFTLEQVPAHLLEKASIWETFLPTLSSRTMLKHFNTLKDLGFLNEGSSFSQQFINVFGNPITFSSEKICPIFLYILMQLYKKNVRYLGTKKSEYYEKKMIKRKITVNPVIQDRLKDMFHQALFNATPAPAKFMIAIDLRRNNARKSVLRNKHINCIEASFLLAYSIFAREKDTLVYTFTGTKDKLEPLHNVLPKGSFEMAKKTVDLYLVDHTYQSLLNPIQEAMQLKKKLDVFLVIVDSVARFCRQGQFPIEEFAEYRKKFNERAKYVIINLTRRRPDLKIPQTDNMKGVFEICGFNANTPKLLYALAKHCFT